jgi:hypothetical protein
MGIAKASAAGEGAPWDSQRLADMEFVRRTDPREYAEFESELD